MSLLEAVERAVARLARTGIDGAELRCPDDRFELVVTGSGWYNHRLVPVAGTLSLLGREEWRYPPHDEGHYEFWLLVLPDGEDHYYLARHPRMDGSTVREIPASDVPEYLLAALAV